MAVRLVKNAKVSVWATTLSLTSWKELAKSGDVVPTCSNKASSQVLIADAFKQHKGIPSEAEVSELAAQVLLHLDEVQMWLKHLQSVPENRKEGASKAAQKRRKLC